MNIEIKRDYYLDKLVQRKHNGLIKVITGIRRCGKSYLMNTIFAKHLTESGVDESHIIKFAFDSADDLSLIGESLLEIEKTDRKVDPEKFMAYIRTKISDKGTYYLLLDEVQLLGSFEAVLNGYLRKSNMDVYVTGSNAKFLSKDVITEFGSRGDEVRMYPLSFTEFMTVYSGNKYDGWNEYITFGGIPIVVLANTEEQKISFLNNLFTETYIRDIVRRNKIRNAEEMEDLLNFLSSSVGSLTNPRKLQSTFKSVKKSKITSTTITKYLEYLEDSFLIESAQRYDIRGKAYLQTPLKYYYMDLGLRNARINFRQQEVAHIMENVIYNELRMRGFNVDVGNVVITEKSQLGKPVKKQLEVDFVCNIGSKRYYIQSAYLLSTEAKSKQELRPLLKIDDSFKKIIITSNTPKPFYTDEGIVQMNVYDFLLNPAYMDY